LGVSCPSGKVEMKMLDLETTITQIKNNKSPRYNEISVNTIKAVGPNGMQWLDRS
jgi:hypothetical protein